MTYTPRLTPYEHQHKGVAKCNGAGGFAYLAEMGCVDGATEYLAPDGWHRIDEWSGEGMVAQFNRETNTASFVAPTDYLRKKVDRFTRFSSATCDQVLSHDHRILEVRSDRPDGYGVTSPREVFGREFRHEMAVTDVYYPRLADDLGPDDIGDDNPLDITPERLGTPDKYVSGDGLMYCFAVPSTYLVLRRNGRVFASGNTGKSCMLQMDWGRLYDAKEVNDLLLIAPAGVYRNWESEINTHMDPAVRESARVFTWKAGGGVTYKDDLNRFLKRRDPGSPRIFLANAESYQSDTGLMEATKTFLTGEKAMAAIDESTLMKNHDAKRTKRIVSLKYMAPYRRILAGLPNPKSPLDLYSQFEFLDRRILGHENFFTYRSEFCTMRRVEIRGPGGALVLNKDGTPKKRPEVTGFRNLEKLKALIGKASYRVTKDECLDLPPKVYMPLREVQLHPEQRRVYDEIKKNATARLLDGSTVVTSQVITQLLRLQQVLCGHVADENGVVHDIPEHRTNALLEDLDAVGGKSIIWTVYRRSIQQIEERVKREFGPRSIVSYYGDTPSDAREEAKYRFQNDSECLFFLGNQQTAGRGITLTKARAVIYHSNSPDLELRMQSEDRAHRAGLDHSVAYSDLHVPGTIDERWVKALRKKLDISGLVLGDELRKWLI